MSKVLSTRHTRGLVRERIAMPSIISARMIQRSLAIAVVLAVLIAQVTPTVAAAAVQPRSFATPQDAAKALFEAANAKDQQAVIAILGPAVRDWILSGDPVQDARRVERFVDAYGRKATVVADGDAKATLSIGDDDFPFPFPIVKNGGTWRFDPEAGRKEVLNRVIGRNELDTIQTLLAVVDAQREYAMRSREDGGIPEYAQRFRSSAGKKDGLFWPVAQGEPQSPLGALIADAVQEGYKAKDGEPVPFHGYYFRILTAQGSKAPGGAYDYMANGRMIGGFAVLAYPARYGISGVKTLAVSHDGIVYETDLGPKTRTIAPRINLFVPDDRWTKADVPNG